MEEAVRERTSQWEARVLQEATRASELTDWQDVPESQSPCCPHCGTTLQARGKPRRERQSREGKRSRSRAALEPVRPVGWGFFPLDEQFALVAGSL